MSTTIIYTPSHTGHNLEYVNNIYKMCIALPLQKFVFVVPEQIKEKLPLMKWEAVEHIKFDFLTKEEQQRYLTPSVLRSHYWITQNVALRARKYQADKVFSLFAYQLALFGWILFPSRVKVSGILYNIYLYDLAILSWRKKILNWLVFSAFAHFRIFDKIFILNDEKGACRLRGIYSSIKFVKLPDPFTPPLTDEEDIRKQYKIEDWKTLLIHFGGMTKRKGTLNILKSLESLSYEECKHYVFFFAGKIDKSIQDEFNMLYRSQEKRVRIIVKDEFCSYGFLGSLCKACDAILMPYLVSSQSSGLLGYASYYHKPVVAPENGLIGDLVNKYKLGVTGDVSKTESLANMYRLVGGKRIKKPTEQYVIENSVNSFLKIVRTEIEDRKV